MLVCHRGAVDPVAFGTGFSRCDRERAGRRDGSLLRSDRFFGNDTPHKRLSEFFADQGPNESYTPELIGEIIRPAIFATGHLLANAASYYLPDQTEIDALVDRWNSALRRVWPDRTVGQSS